MIAALDKPSLLYVVGIPVGFMVVLFVLAGLLFWSLGRFERH